MSSLNPNNRPEPDELDALLHMIGPSDMLEENEIRVSERSIPHRKSLSLFWGTTTSTARQYRSRHRKNKSSISDLYHAIKDYDLAPIREDFHRTSLEVKKQFVRELQEMNRGQVAFFDMSMTRSLSVLPDDIPYLAHETISSTTPSETPSESASTSLENKQQGPNIGHYLALFLAVFAVSSKSTGFHLLDHVKAPLKQYWKMTATSVGLFPFALVAIQKDGIRSLTLSQWLTFVAAIVCYSIQNVLFVKSLEFTTVGNACIYANSQALLLIVGKACVGDKIHWMEGIGVMIAFSGAILCTKDAEEQSSRDMDSSTNGKFGDVLALMSAVAGVFYLTFAKAVRSGISVSTFVFGVMFFGQFFILTFLQLTSGDTLEYNLNMYDGVFGWLNMHRLPIMIYMVAVVNMVGTMGFVRAMEHFDNIVIAVATLMEPLMASLIAFACHAGLLPGPIGWLGNFLVVIGTLGVVYPSIGKVGADTMH